MKTIISVKKIPRAPRRPTASATRGIARQPRIVAKETSIIPQDAGCAAWGVARPPASAIAVIAEGTYTVPAQRPQIETNIKRAFTMVRRRQAAENSVAKGRQTAHDRTTVSFFFQAAGSVTPWRIQASRSAGTPPTINMARQP